MNVARICKLLFAAAGAAILVFVLCVIFMDSDDSIWRAFSVCMPITGICFTVGIMLLIVDFIRKR